MPVKPQAIVVTSTPTAPAEVRMPTERERLAVAPRQLVTPSGAVRDLPVVAPVRL